MAVTTPIRRVILTANEAKKKISQGNESIKNIGQVILKRTKVKREAFAQTNLFRKRREESEKRMMLEDELEAPRVAAIPTGAQQLVEKTGAKGFFNRILGFLGYLAAGWLMNNLPTWIAMGKEFIARIRKAGEIVSGFFNNTIKLFTGVGNLLSSLGQNLLQFDFFDTSNRVKNSMSELNNTMGSLTGQIEEAFSLLTTPLTEGKYSGEEIPETGTQQTDQGAYEEPPPYAGSGGGGRWKPLLDVIASGEGGYESVNPGQVVPGLTQMTIAEAWQTAQQVGRSKRGSGAMGRYQLLSDPIGRAKRAGLDPYKDKFSPENQDKIAVYILENIRYGKDWLSGKLNDAAFAQGIANEWAGVPNLSGKYSYSGQGGKVKASSVKSALSQVKKGYSQPQPSRQTPNKASLPALPPTDTLGGGVQRYGASRRGGRKHAGTDFDISGNEKFFSRIGGTVVKTGVDPGGYGNYIDIYNSQLGVYERIAEGARVLVKKGQSVQPGQAVVQGEGPTGVIHYEIRKNSGYGFAGTLDPISFLKSSSTQKQVESSPAQIAAAPQQSQTVPSALTPERRGQDIVIIDQPRQQQNIITPAASGGGAAPSPISDFDLLNNFIKNKLLLDLAYL